MKIKLLGTRGSIPTPGRDTVKYGGNTTCVDLTLNSGEKIVIDAGSGMRLLSQEILSEKINHINLLSLLHFCNHCIQLAVLKFENLILWASSAPHSA